MGFAGLSMAIGLLVATAQMLNPGHYYTQSYTWLHLPATGQGVFPNGFSLVIGILVDPISALMLIVVTVVGFLVMLYSIGYMHHEEGLPRYYAEISLFLTAMTALVLSNNLFEFFLFWELVGVCSYFLIGFFYKRPAAASAAKEAFIVTRIGDVLFMLGIFIYFYVYATAGPAPGWAASGFLFTNGTLPFLQGATGNPTLLTVAGLMMLAGAAGKSAQFPLHVWLPDAMEGPTTVSALIHAATMVAAGVYLLAVVSLFIGFTSTDLFAIVAVGGFTTFFAATMAVVNPDIKRVIAYSTISQLGYMVLAIGAGFTMVGLFHLFTHAFFKALLFLAAGAVIHAIGSQDLFKMGGLNKRLRIASFAFLVGALALSGIPPFSGFFSKDNVIGSVYSTLGAHPDYWPFFILAVATVFLTGYYIFRAYFLAFSGTRTRDPTLPEPHPTPWVMAVPLLILSGLAIISGFFFYSPAFDSLLPGPNIPWSLDIVTIEVAAVDVALAAGGIFLAWWLWGNGRVFVLDAKSPLQSVRNLLLKRYYFKAGYDWVGGVAVYTLARVADFGDRYVVDGTVRAFEGIFAGSSNRLRKLQTGIVSDYAAYVVTGLVGLILLLLFVGPYVLRLWGGA